MGGVWATFDGNHPILDEVREWVPTYRRQAWRTALTAVGLEDQALVGTAQAAFANAQARGHPLVKGAAQTINELGRRYRLGLLTNGPSDIQRLKLQRTGLASRFETVSISGETGLGKPTPAAFVVGRVETEGQTPRRRHRWRQLGEGCPRGYLLGIVRRVDRVRADRCQRGWKASR